MSAFDELRSLGRFGPEGAKLLYSTMQAVGTRRGFPPPDGYTAWDSDAAISAAHEFLVHNRTKARMTYLAVHSTDDESLRRLLARVLLNYLRDLGRATEMGKLILRINDVLASDARFVRSDSRWRLDVTPETPSTVPPRDLVSAAGSVDRVVVPRWTSEVRVSPVADAESIVSLCHAVLAAADGSLATPELARAMAHRLGLNEAPIGNVLEGREPVDQSFTAAVDFHASDAAARLVFGSLSEMERKVIATAHLPLRDVYEVVGLRKSQASSVRGRVVALINQQLVGLENPDAARLKIVDLAQRWLADRTPPAFGTP